MHNKKLRSLALLVAVLLNAQQAAAFKVGVHRAITLDALYRGRLAYNKAHVSFTREAVDAIDKEAAALDRASNLSIQFPEHWRHFDNESFEEGNAHIISMKQDIIEILSGKRGALNKDKLKTAYQELAYSIHAIQDFYAHSNWVELGFTKVCPTLGVSPFRGEVDGPDGRKVKIAGPGDEVCTGDYNLTPKGRTMLTSGYWPGLTHCSIDNDIKCHHGLTFSILGIVTLCDREGISKDSEEGSAHDKPSTTPSNIPVPSPNPYKIAPMHGMARSLAEQATRLFVEQILADSGVQNNCQNVARFLGVVPTPD